MKVMISALLGVLLLAHPAMGQGSGRSAPVVTVGAVAGGAAGFVVGALVGGSIAGRGCETGNPDACFGQSFPGYIWGAGAGMTLGIPAGAHLANKRAGSFGKSLAVSAAIFGAEVLALRALVDDGRTRHKELTLGIAAIAPLIQIVTSVAIERSTSR